MLEVGLAEGGAVIRHYRLGCEKLDYVSFESVDCRSQVDPGPSNSLWFQHVAIVVSDMNRAAERLMSHVVPISESPQWLPNGRVGISEIADRMRPLTPFISFVRKLL